MRRIIAHLRSLSFLALLGLIGCAHFEPAVEQKPQVVKKSCNRCTYNRAIYAAVDYFQLGQPQSYPKQLNGGLTNRVYSIDTTMGKFVVKLMRKETSRTRSLSALKEIEHEKRRLARKHSLPIVFAKTSGGEPVFETADFYILVFDYIEGRVLAGPLGPVTEKQAYQAGKYLGKIHTEKLSHTGQNLEFIYTSDLSPDSKLKTHYKQYTEFWDLAEKTQKAYQRLRKHQVHSHGDYQPHNIIVQPSGQLHIIDWELSGLINPGMELMAALITFSGYATENYDPAALNAFLKGYKNSGGHLPDNLEDAIDSAIHMLWTNWITYNMEINNQQEVEKSLSSLSTIIKKIPTLKRKLK